MWYRTTDAVVLTLVVGNDSLFFIVGQKSYKQSYKVLGYTTFVSSAYEIHNGIIYNYSSIRNALSLYIKIQKIRPSFVTIIVDNKQVSNSFFVATQPLLNTSAHSVHTMQPTHTHYIGPCHETDHLLYKCTIAPHALLQYQLLIKHLHVPLLSISCAMQPLLCAYRGYKRDVFRSSELVQDIIKNDIYFIDFFTQDMVHRLLPNVCVLDSNYKKALLMSYGHALYQELLRG